MLFMMIPLFVACSNDDKENDIDYSEQIVGTWRMTHIDSGKGYSEVPLTMKQTTATFKDDGTYVGQGYFGNGYGTYKLKGSEIKCYVDGVLYVTYNILDLNGNKVELEMFDNSAKIKIKCIRIK